MKKVKLCKIEPGNRMVDIVSKIEGLEFSKYGDLVMSNGNTIYSYKNNSINFTANDISSKDYDTNILLNKYKMAKAIDSNIREISQEQFCNLLQEHLKMEAHAKMEELLPKIKQWYPDAHISDCGEILRLSNGVDELGDADILHYYKCNLSVVAGGEYWYHDKIWEDKDTLTVKEKKTLKERLVEDVEEFELKEYRFGRDLAVVCSTNGYVVVSDSYNVNHVSWHDKQITHDILKNNKYVGLTEENYDEFVTVCKQYFEDLKKPWYEKQNYFYYAHTCGVGAFVESEYFDDIMLTCDRKEWVEKYKNVFETEEKAQTMCDKLNAVLNGQQDIHGEMQKKGYRMV